MKTHHLQLAAKPFEAIKAGDKTIESRLYDEKRQTISPGDILVFTNREDESRTVSVQVIGLLRYQSFHDLFSHTVPAKFGGDTAESLERQINEFYSVVEQTQNGVLGIEFKLV